MVQAKASFGTYRGYQDQLEDQLSQVRGEAEDRLFELVGAYPSENAYETPTENEGSEFWQQAQSIEQAQLRIRRNQVEMSNLREEIEIEVSRSAHLYDVTIGYGAQNANLAQEIAFRQGAQESLNTIAGAGFDPIALPLSIFAGVYGHFGTTRKVAELEGDKEMLAAWEQAEILEIESRAIVKTLASNEG